MSCTVCTQSGVIEDLMRAEGQRGRELDEKSLNPVNQLLRRAPPPRGVQKTSTFEFS